MRVRGLVVWAKGLFARAFLERQLFVRAGGQVRFLTLSRRRQATVAALVVAIVGWSVYVSVVYFSYDARLSASEAKIAETRAAYERVMAERDTAATKARDAYRDFLPVLEQPFAALARARIESQSVLATLRTRNAELSRQMAELDEALAAARAERERLANAESTLARQRAVLENELAELKSRNTSLDAKVASLKNDLSGAESRQAILGRDHASQSEALAGTEREVADLRRRTEAAAAQQAGLEKTLAAVTGERDKMSLERAQLGRHVDELQQHLAALQSDQTALIARLSERATSHSVAVERTIAMTGLDVNKLLREASKDEGRRGSVEGGQGGPFVAYHPLKGPAGKPSARSSEIERVVSTLDRQEERRAGLRRILDRLPLAPPLDAYRVVSDFGPRIDPFNGRLAMHQGVDLASEANSPVFATAPGVVTMVGWNGRYGKMVEIDHGMGIRTRYAHLKASVVEVGRKVAARTQIGVIGSTGRSTGTHVHYEILVDDRPYNPVKFMKAGDYVFSKD